ncbi:coiled-coil domain-containing protein AGAP005037-like isoform X4 [Octopus sinensis]|uniref:Coiled-coil domain-containing protein AGAP005037-like isoform X4 n=1 Tax=Octopus sinensis TaxID=2607531 RepID=A0A7E6F367_9MOLL|nr:coiled-coil domain-containing protein AGAP005037-like isoform X4 [Octopus sinensis]
MSASDSEGEETVLQPELIPLLENQPTRTAITTITTPINSASSTTVSVVSSNNLPLDSNTNSYNSSGSVLSVATTTNDITNSTTIVTSSSPSFTSTSTTTTSVVSDSSTGNSGLPATDKSQAKVKSPPAAKIAAVACCHSRKLSLNGNSSFQSSDDDSQTKKEIFMDLLARRYVQYAEKIKDNSKTEDFSHCAPHQRDQRRRATIVTYNSNLNQSVEYDDNGTMSDIETSSAGNIQRGQYLRSSLPIIRSSSSTFERPLGLVFLVYKDETKKASLPNEITTLDTVRALFVRSFADKLTMEFMESPRNKIYIVDPRTNIYYQLEDLRDIKDRTVLKIHECDSDQPQIIKPLPEIRGKTIVSSVQSQSNTHPVNVHIPSSCHPKNMTKSKSLPPQNSIAYQQLANENQSLRIVDRPQSTTPGMDVMRGQSGIVPRHMANLRFSPERQTTPDRASLLGTIPENSQLSRGRGTLNGYSAEVYPAATYNPGYWPTEQPYSHPRDGCKIAPPNWSLPYSAVPSIPSTLPPTLEGTPVCKLQRSQSYRANPEREPVPERIRSMTPQPPQDPETKVRMERMEAQLANLTAWVHNTVIPSRSHHTNGRTSSMRSNCSTVSDSTCTGSTASKNFVSYPSGLSDIPGAAQSGYPAAAATHSQKSTRSKYTNQPPVIGPNTRVRMILVKRKVEELKADLKNLQFLHRKNTETGQTLMAESTKKILNVLSRISFTVSLHPIRKERHDVDANYTEFVREEKRIDQELCKLEDSVEEVRTDVISKHCRVNSTDVEKMALTLSQLSKAIAEQKAHFPQLQDKMKKIMSEEMDIIIQEEKFLKDQPERLESALRRCKKLTGTLFTLKSPSNRLASVQQHNRCLSPTPLSQKAPITASSPSLLPQTPMKVVNNDKPGSIQIILNYPKVSSGQQQHENEQKLSHSTSHNSADTSSGSSGNNVYSLTHNDDQITSRSGECTYLPSTTPKQNVGSETQENQMTPSKIGNNFRSSSQTSSNQLQINSVKSDFTDCVSVNPTTEVSCMKPVSAPEKTSRMALISESTSPNKELFSGKSTENSKESSANLINKIHSARADFFSSMLTSENSATLNKNNSYSPTTKMDYTVHFSSPKPTFTIANCIQSTAKNSPKPIMSTATAVAELWPKDPPPISKKPSHLWKVRPSSHNYDGTNVAVCSGSSSHSVLSLPYFSNSSKSLPTLPSNNKSDCETKIAKRSPPPPPPRKNSKNSYEVKPAPTSSTPQIVHYTLTQHCNPSMSSSFSINTPLQHDNKHPKNNTRDNSPSKESACSSGSSASSDSQHSVVRVPVLTQQNGNGFNKKNKPSPPQRKSSQLSHLPASTHSPSLSKPACWEQPVFNGVKGLSMNTKRDLQETAID